MSAHLIESTPSARGGELLIKNILTTPLSYAPQQEIVYRDVHRYTYRTLVERIARLTNMLRQHGIKPGDTVAMMDWDSHRYLECFFAVPMMGAVLHTINIRLSPEQLIYTINHAEDDLILVNAEFLPLLEAVRDQLQDVKKIILLTDDATTPQTPLALGGEYEALLAPCDTTCDYPDLNENTRATTFYTTGTTGLPKGVYFSHRQLVVYTYALSSALTSFRSHAPVDSGDVYMPITPMFHSHAWGFPYVMTLLGNKQIYPGRYEPKVLLKLVVSEKVTLSHCVPTILHMMITSPAVQQAKLSDWKVIIGGSALPTGLCKAALALGINVYAGYGLSEACPVLSVSNLKPHMLEWDMERQIEIRCRAGLPLPNADLRLIDAEGHFLPHDGISVGEVVARAPWLTQGYFKDPEMSEKLWAGGWLHTGDVGFIDTEGYLQVTDRLKDVIKTGGEWVSSLELEDIISQHEAVSEAAVIAVPDEKWGERPLGVVVLKEAYKDTVSEADLRAFFNRFVEQGSLPKFGVPNRILLVDTIAKTSVGKMDKKLLRQQVREIM